MAAAAAAVKLHMRVSRLPEAAVVLQAERTWVQEAVGDLARKGKSLGAAIIGSAGLLLPYSRPTKKSQDIPSDRVVSLVASSNMSSSVDCEISGLRLRSVQPHPAMVSDLGRDSQGVGYIAGKGVVIERELTSALEDDDYYRWETDPNGGWLSSFP